MLFGKKYWMDTKITVDRSPKLLEYLTTQLNITVCTPEDFGENVTEEFLKNKSDEWFLRFYEKLNGKLGSLCEQGEALRGKPFIRLENGEQTAPFDNEDNPKVFLPLTSGPQMDYETISPNVIKSKASLTFIKNKLGIKEPDFLDKIKHQIIPLYKDETSFPSKTEHLKHLRQILEFYQKAKEVLKTEIVELFSNTDIKFIHAVNTKTGEKSYKDYQNVYLHTPDLERYFRFSKDIYFLNLDIYSSLPRKEIIQFLSECGVQDYPWKIEFDPEFSEEKKKSLRLNSRFMSDEITSSYPSGVTDLKLEGLDDLFAQKEPAKEDSKFIWKVLSTYIKEDANSFKGRYSWYRREWRDTTFESYLLNQLKEKAWLYTNIDTEGPQISKDILIKDLAAEFDTHSEEARALVDQLKFKTEAEQGYFEQMPLDRRERLNRAEDILKFCDETGTDLIDALELLKASREVETNEFENAPDIKNVNAVEDVFAPVDYSKIEVAEIGANENLKGDTNKDKNGNQGENQMSQEMKNELGHRGEMIVFSFLKKKWNKKATLINETENEMIYQNKERSIFTISILNKEGKKGIGCDILIKNEEEIYEYIEVKSSKLVKKGLFPVTGYQWSLAYKIFNQGEGNKYSFYIVKDVLGATPKITQIKNPIKKWKDGELRAHPINLEL